jgi:hypothetical protein
VIQTGLYLSVLGPSFVYVRFRCGRCRRIGEQLVQQSEWDPTMLRQEEARITEADRRRYEGLGEITAEEVIDFHYAVARLSAEPRTEG